MAKNKCMILAVGISSFAVATIAVIAIIEPDVRWVGAETGYGRETEWNVVPVNNLDQSPIASNSQREITFKPQGDNDRR